MLCVPHYTLRTASLRGSAAGRLGFAKRPLPTLHMTVAEPGAGGLQTAGALVVRASVEAALCMIKFSDGPEKAQQNTQMWHQAFACATPLAACLAPSNSLLSHGGHCLLPVVRGYLLTVHHGFLRRPCAAPDNFKEAGMRALCAPAPSLGFPRGDLSRRFWCAISANCPGLSGALSVRLARVGSIFWWLSRAICGVVPGIAT